MRITWLKTVRNWLSSRGFFKQSKVDEEDKPYACPVTKQCKWRGPLEKIATHITNEPRHQLKEAFPVADDTGFRTDLDIPFNCIRFCRLIQHSCGHQFIIKIKSKQIGLVVSLKIIGTQEQAQNCSYQLTMTGYGRLVTLKAKPQSICEPVSFMCILYEQLYKTSEVDFLESRRSSSKNAARWRQLRVEVNIHQHARPIEFDVLTIQ